MSTMTMPSRMTVRPTRITAKHKRIESIDLLRGTVMIIMAIDHVRDYFHSSAFLYDPTNLDRTSVPIFFTRWITHFCAPIFMFLAGISAYLYGNKRSRKELSFFLFTRGAWLVFVEFVIMNLGRTFNPLFHFINLQVIWAIGISMIALSAIIYLDRRVILTLGILLIAGHNLLDNVHIPGTGLPSILWALLHEQAHFSFGHFSFFVHYPVLPWIGIISTGYFFGSLFTPGINPYMRKKIFLLLGFGAIALFIILRSGNWYGDAAHWSTQRNMIFSLMSFLNVTKYPPSLLYTLMTLGPALIFLALAEKPLNKLTEKISIYGRVPMFYYIVHIYLIHLLAVIAAFVSGHEWTDMILTTRLNATPELKGYGFDLTTVYAVWAGIIIMLYPLCKWFDKYKRSHQATKWWLSYL